MHRVVFELSAAAPEQWDAVLNNVENLQESLAGNGLEIELVAHGKALPLLQKNDSRDPDRLARLARSGVTFAACANTMRRNNVQRADLFDFAVTVDSGVAEVVRKQEAGWAYIKGGG